MLSRLLTRREQAILAGVAGAIVMGSAVLYLQPGSAPPSLVVVPAQAVPVETGTPEIAVAPPAPPVPQASLQPAPQANVGVAVAGAVMLEGYHELPPGSRVTDLIEAAGGALPEADLRSLNLSARLLDATTLTVPRRPGGTYPEPVFNPLQYLRSHQQQAAYQSVAPSSLGGAPQPPGDGGLVNLNTATQQELESLPGIGPALAARIMTYRAQQPFRTVDDLDHVSGFGESRMATLRPLVTVQ